MIKSDLIFNESHAQLPTPIFINKNWYIFYANKLNKKSFIQVAIFSTEFKLLEIKDVLFPGERGCFDDSGVMPSCVLIRNNKFYLYYSGWNLDKGGVPYGHGIGLAIGSCSLNFERYSDGPLIDRSIDNPYLSNSLFLNKNTGYFCGGIGWHDNFAMYGIKRCKTNDGIYFKDFNIVLHSSSEAISRPCSFNNKIYSSIKTVDSNYEIYKIDIFEEKREKLVFEKHHWNDQMQCYPYLIHFGNANIGFYNGNNYGETGFGYFEL